MQPESWRKQQPERTGQPGADEAAEQVHAVRREDKALHPVKNVRFG
jgi:hypothetical protein